MFYLATYFRCYNCGVELRDQCVVVEGNPYCQLHGKQAFDEGSYYFFFFFFCFFCLEYSYSYLNILFLYNN